MQPIANLYKKPQPISSLKRTIADREVNNWKDRIYAFHHCLFCKHLPGNKDDLYQLRALPELHMILAFAISIMLPFTYRCSYEDSQWKANKFPPLCRQNLESQAAVELLRQPALSHYVFTQCKWEQPSGTDWESGRAHRTSLYLQLFKDKRVQIS